MKESYANEPQSIGEIRANKDSECAKQTPRDALIALLRRIDAGELKTERLIVCHDERFPDGNMSTHYEAGGKLTYYESLGLLDAVKNIILHS